MNRPKDFLPGLKRGALLPLAFVFLLACDNDEQIPQPEIINSISVVLDNDNWQPSQIGDDGCMSTFQCDYREIKTSEGQTIPFYTIQAFRDPGLEASYKSENALQFQVMNVTEIGTYNIEGKFGADFQSYARFTVNNEDGTFVRYENDPDRNPFIVVIDELLSPYSNLSFGGIKGSFYGSLYNFDNPSDSLNFENGKFVLKKTNSQSFNQCSG